MVMSLHGCKLLSKYLSVSIRPLTRIQSHSLQAKRFAHYETAKHVDPSKRIEFETSVDSEEWKYVERLLPLKVIPEPKPKESYPSGWKPQSSAALGLPYFVRRTKNYMTPVYLHISQRGLRRVTVIGKIQGDINALAHDLEAYLVETTGKSVGVKVDELGMKVKLRGDYVFYTQQWLDARGF